MRKNWQFWRFFDQSVSPKRCKIGPRLLWITTRKSHTRFWLVQKSTTLDDHELTVNGYYALCCITHMSFGAHHKKNWMKIDPHYQQHKCSPGIAVFSNIRFMRIFAGIRWTWASNGSGFSLILPAISSEPSHLRPHLLYYAKSHSGSSVTPK